MYLEQKYGELLHFDLKDLAEVILGKDWKESEAPIVANFRKRMFWRGLNIDNDIKEPILFGKIIADKNPMRYPELVLFSELALDKSIIEVDKLIKSNKVKLKTIEK